MTSPSEPGSAERTPDADELLPAYVLGLLEDERASSVDSVVRSTPALRRRARTLAAAATAVSLAATPLEDEGAQPQVELRLIQRARDARPPAVRPRRSARAVIRVFPWLVALGLIALLAVFGWLAFQPEDPISGRAIPLTEDGATGVLLPRYESRGFALVFWGLHEAANNETWQLWYVRVSGAVEPGPSFIPDADGRVALALDPNALETDDPLIGFAVSLDVPHQRSGATPLRDAILYQFPSR